MWLLELWVDKTVLCGSNSSNCSPSNHTLQDPAQDPPPPRSLLWPFQPTLIIHSILELRILAASLPWPLTIYSLVTSLVLLSYINVEFLFKSFHKYVISIHNYIVINVGVDTIYDLYFFPSTWHMFQNPISMSQGLPRIINLTQQIFLASQLCTRHCK